MKNHEDLIKEGVAGRTVLVRSDFNVPLDGTRITRFPDRSIEMAFRIAGTDLAPRLRLSALRLASISLDDLVGIVRRVASSALGCP